MKTIEQIKEELPNVKVELNPGEVLECHIKGRKNDFATVLVPVKGFFVSYEFSWATITRAINNGKILKIIPCG